MAGLVRVVSSLLAVALVAGGCTLTGDDPEQDASPSPSPTRTSVPEAPDEVVVGLVVGPDELVPAGEAAALAAAARGQLGLDGVDRVVTAVADDAAFAGDLLRLFADDGADLVCLLGTGTGPVLAAAAASRPGTAFCGTDPTLAAPPANVTVTGLDLRAVASVLAAGLDPASDGVAVVATALTLTEPARLTTAVAPRLPVGAAQPVPSGTPTVDPTPAPGSSSPLPTSPPTSLEPRERVVPILTTADPATAAAVLERRILGDEQPPIGNVLVLGGRVDAELARAAAAAGLGVVGIASWLVDEEGQLPPGVRVAAGVAWEELLVAAVGRARTTPGAAPEVIGVELLQVLPGTSSTTGALDRAVAALAAAGGREPGAGEP